MQLASAKSRTTLLHLPDQTHTSDPEEDDVHTFFAITEYHPTQHGFRGCIEKNWDILGSPATKKIFESKIIYGHRRPKNLREHLVRANFKPSIVEVSLDQAAKRLKEKTCGSPGRCRYCKKLDTGGTIRGKSDSRTFRTRTQVTCRSDNLIYAIEFTLCGMHYVGQTKKRLINGQDGHPFCLHFWRTIKIPSGLPLLQEKQTQRFRQCQTVCDWVLSNSW